jgi:hypothetical protein
MTIGRPTKYNEEILVKTQEYIDSCEDTDADRDSDIKARVNLPTIEGLAYEIKVNKDTIYEWCKEHQEFSDIIDDLRAKQAKQLVNKGLAGTYNPTIAKVLLTKHGYREGLDNTTNDKDLPNPIISIDRKD